MVERFKWANLQISVTEIWLNSFDCNARLKKEQEDQNKRNNK